MPQPVPCRQCTVRSGRLLHLACVSLWRVACSCSWCSSCIKVPADTSTISSWASRRHLYHHNLPCSYPRLSYGNGYFECDATVSWHALLPMIRVDGDTSPALSSKEWSSLMPCWTRCDKWKPQLDRTSFMSTLQGSGLSQGNVNSRLLV